MWILGVLGSCCTLVIGLLSIYVLYVIITLPITLCRHYGLLKPRYKWVKNGLLEEKERVTREKERFSKLH